MEKNDIGKIREECFFASGRFGAPPPAQTASATLWALTEILGVQHKTVAGALKVPATMISAYVKGSRSMPLAREHQAAALLREGVAVYEDVRRQLWEYRQRGTPWGPLAEIRLHIVEGQLALAQAALGAYEYLVKSKPKRRG